MKVYLVEEMYDNGMSYEDWDHSNTVVAVCITREKALEYIQSLEIRDGWKEGDPYETEDDYYNDNHIRTFYHEPFHKGDEWELEWYEIKEMEVS